MSHTIDTWKIERDNYFNELYQLYGYDHIDTAGFFMDSAAQDFDVVSTINILCTPFGNLNLNEVDNNTCVLLSTGGFAPIHTGHIEMIKAAKIAVENAGWKVACGYIAPDHDQYIKSKCADKSIDIFERISIINYAIKEIDWLVVDPWAGIFNTVAINYTDIITRLQAYLKHHLGKDIPVFFVCGGDNARFALTFEKMGHCVVVGRPIYEDRFDHYKNLENDRIIFTDGFVELSSTQIRKTRKLSQLKEKSLVLISNGHTLDDAVTHAMVPYFKNIDLLKKTDDCNKNCITISGYYEKTITLDKDIQSKHSLQVSRYYNLFGAKLVSYGNRPGSLPIDAQCTNIPKGTYRIFDSDVHTGGTIRYVTEQLKRFDIKIESISSLVKTYEEILDVEDFCIDNGSGLVVVLPNGNTTRVPYVLPYIDCRERCSALDPYRFSIDIWKLNKQFFDANPKTLNDIQEFQQIFLMAGFQLHDSMQSVCDWHIELLSRLQLPNNQSML